MRCTLLTGLVCALVLWPGVAVAGKRLPGWDAFDAGAYMAASSQSHLRYAVASSAVEAWRDCLHGDAGQAPRWEAAFRALVATQQQHVTPAQWAALERDLAGSRPSVTDRLRCEGVVWQWSRFDQTLSGLLAADDEQERLAGRDPHLLSDPRRLVLGVQLQGVDPPVVVRLLPGSPLINAGLREHDALVSINGKPVASEAGVVLQLLDSEPGNVVEVGWQRWDEQAGGVAEGQVYVVPVTAGSVSSSAH